MTEADDSEPGPILQRMKDLADAGRLRLTQHAHQEMAAEEISLDEVLQAIESAELLEDYPQHRRGACCLVHGTTAADRHLHIVCTTARPVLIIITVYEPTLPKWVTPTERAPMS